MIDGSDALLREAYETMKHAHIFIYTREKMHPDGRLLYEATLRKLEGLVFPSSVSETDNPSVTPTPATSPHTD